MEPATGAVEPLEHGSAGTTSLVSGPARPSRPARVRLAFERVRFAVLVYLGSRVLLLVVAIVNGGLRHHAVLNELANWDGYWYRAVANLGAAGSDGVYARVMAHGHVYFNVFHGGFYPHHIYHSQTNLGFLPLYPLVIWLVGQPVKWLLGHSTIWSITLAGVVVSTIGGLVATLIVERLAEGWWGRPAARRAVLLFCLFPGSVVFSMVYAEGLAIPLAAGCILALQRRRWLLAGFLAGVATATVPEAVVLIVVCAVQALLHVRREGARGPGALRAAFSPVLAASGIVGVGAFLWAWTGSPFATFITQHYGWHEKTDPLALVHLVTRLAHQISFRHFNHPTINLNLLVGIAGAILLVVGLVLLLNSKRRISLPAAVWTLGIGLVAVTSEYVPPNPRLLITAFPAVLVFAYRLRGAGWNWFLAANSVALAGLSALTFVGVTLRP